MKTARIEHVNLSVEQPVETAEQLCRLFAWRIRWQGPSPAGGYTVHVGDDEDYLSLYCPPGGLQERGRGGMNQAGFNHLGVVVEDLDEVEQRVREAGFATFDHDDYEPGRRFYFRDGNGIDFEVVSYA
jgi:predicted enzyme related to lactoylglutathione lyase